MNFDASRATEFVKSIDLSGTPRGILRQDAASAAGEVFDKAKSQAQIVGSGVFSFAQGVTTEVREAISDSALLAQLVANKQVSADDRPLDWFGAYSKVLQNVGWTLQEAGWNDYTAKGTAVEVNEKILEVMTVALGPAPAALAIITATINALKSMNANSPWITLFSRESQKAKIARFQIGLVEREETSDVFVSLLACLIEAHNNITQVLFFKFKDAGASFKANSGKVSINRQALTQLAPSIRAKILSYQSDYLSTVLNV
jgi:hypothetical protein